MYNAKENYYLHAAIFLWTGVLSVSAIDLLRASNQLQDISTTACTSQFAEHAKNRADVPSDSKQGHLSLTNNKSTCSWTFNSEKDSAEKKTTLEYSVLPAFEVSVAPQ
jgi:hypothetical protein